MKANTKKVEYKLPHQQTELYKQLEKRNDHDALSKVDSFVGLASKYLTLFGHEAFSTFTLHDDNHSINLLKIAGKIIPQTTLNRLSSLELIIIIYSFYFHDIGMAISYANKESILGDAEFLAFLQSKPDFNDKIQELSKLRQKSDLTNQAEIDLRIADIYHAALTDFVRPRHAKQETYQKFINELTETEQSLFSYKEVSFLDELISICYSHNEPTITLSMQDEYGKKIYDTEYVLCGEKLNVQYCAMILRLCDILDFDRERTPDLLFRAIGIEDRKMPGFKISLKEWQKQMGVNTISYEDDCLKVFAKCSNPNIEKAIRAMCADVEREIRDTLSLLKDNKKAITDNYQIKLPVMVVPIITAEKYVYKDYSIKLNENAIIKLLMGENLYPKPETAVRELLQNAIDACLVHQGRNSAYVPHIDVYFENEDDQVWLVVKDDGIGMDEYVLSHYFLEIGKSYYTSSDFKILSAEKDFKSFNPISRFGIGFLSVFMVGDYVKVYTRNNFSKTNTNGSVLLVDGTESLAVFKKDNTLHQGTVIKVRLKHKFKENENLRGLIGHIKEVFIRPAVPIKINYEGVETVLQETEYLSLKKVEEERLEKEGVVPVKVDFSKYSDIISGIAYFFFFRAEDGLLYHYDPTDIRVWEMDTLKMVRLFDNLEHVNLVTVNGIKMSVKKIGKLFNARKKIVPYAIDVNISSSSEVVFDVTRQKLIGSGLDYVRCGIIDIVIKALGDLHIYDQLADETKKRFTNAKIIFGRLEPLDNDLLQEIAKYCPDGYFPIDNAFVREVAEQVDVVADVVRPYLFAIRSNKRKTS